MESQRQGKKRIAEGTFEADVKDKRGEAKMKRKIASLPLLLIHVHASFAKSKRNKIIRKRLELYIQFYIIVFLLFFSV